MRAAAIELRADRLLAWVGALCLVLLASARVGAQESSGDLSLPPMVVTAERREKTELETKQHVSVVSAEDIRDQGAATVPAAIEEETGVWMQRTAQGHGSPFIRGLTGKQVLILVDGVRFNNSTFRYGPNQYLNTIDAGLVERIEVVRGPGSVMYGSDALGGVINIITDHGPDPAEGPASARFTLTERLSSADMGSVTRIEAEGVAGAVGWTVGAGYKHFGDLRAGDYGSSPLGVVDIDGKQPFTGYDEMNFNAAMRWQLAPGRELRAAYMFTRQNEVPRSDKMIESAYNTSPSTYIYDPQQAQLFTVDYAVRDAGPLETFTTTLSYNHQKEGRMKSSYAEDEIGTLGLAASAAFKPLGRQTLNAGFELYCDSISSTTTALPPDGPKFPDGSTYDTFGVYVRDEISVSDRFSVAVGGRYSSHGVEASLGGTVVDLTSTTQETYNDISPTYSDFTWSFDAMYDIGPESSVYLNIARGFRAPNMDDLAADGDWSGGNDVPNPDVDSEYSISCELGVKHEGDSASGGASLFYSDYTDLIARAYYATGLDDTQGTGDDVFRMENVGKAEIYGAELWGRTKLGGAWSLFGDLAYTYGQNLTDDEPLRRMPPLNGKIGLRRETDFSNKWFELFAEGATKQDRLSSGDLSDTRRIPPGGTPGWATLNVRGGMKLSERASLTLGAYNITDLRYRVHGSGMDAPGVNVVAAVECNF